MTTKVSSEKHTLNCFVCLFTLIYLFVKSLPWPLDTHGSKISFYRNIVSRVNKALNVNNRLVILLNFKLGDVVNASHRALLSNEVASDLQLI